MKYLFIALAAIAFLTVGAAAQYNSQLAADATKDAEAARESAASAREQLKAFQKNLSAKEQSALTVGARNSALESELASAKSDTEAAKAAAAETAAKLKQEITALQKQVADLMAAMKKLQELVTAKNAQISEAQQSLQEANRKLAESTAKQAELSKRLKDAEQTIQESHKEASRPEAAKPRRKASPSATLNRAIEDAQDSGRRVAVIFRGEPCPFCDHLEQEVLHTARFRELAARKFVVCELTLADDEETWQLLRKDIRGVPLALVIDPRNEDPLHVVKRFTPKTVRRGLRMYDIDTFLSELE